jgi:PAS domain-containing protein
MYIPTESAEGQAFEPIPAWPGDTPLAEPMWRRSDAMGLATDFNAAWLRFTERSPQSAVRNGWLQDVHPDDRARCVAIHADMQDQRLPYALDFRLRHTRRGHRWLMERAIPLFAPDGRFAGFDHHCTDIHDRMQLEEELAERSRRLRCAMRTQALFATALAAELDRLLLARVQAALGVMARLAAQAPGVRRAATNAGDWLADLRRGLPDDERSLPDGWQRVADVDTATVWVDPHLLGPALNCAIACAALLGCGPAPCRAERRDGSLLLEIPALPGSSGFVLLDLALRLHGCRLDAAVDNATRWRTALPLA